jgi:hypothetical protein
MNPFPGKNNLEKSAVQQELNQKIVQNRKKNCFQVHDNTASERNHQNKSRRHSGARNQTRRNGPLQDHTRPHSSFQTTHTKTEKPNTSRTNSKLHHGRRNELKSINEQATEHGGVGMAGKYLPAKPPEPGGRCRTTTRASFSFPVADGPIRLPAPRSEGGIRAGEGRGERRKDSSF